jgi:hypothetical protein
MQRSLGSPHFTVTTLALGLLLIGCGEEETKKAGRGAPVAGTFVGETQTKTGSRSWPSWPPRPRRASSNAT